MRNMRNRMIGVTLIEVLLVTVIISAMLYMMLGYLQQRTLQARLDKSAAQMQQVLNAALAFYAANNATWPPGGDVSCLQGSVGVDPACSVRYIPGIVNPFWPGASYSAHAGSGRYLIATAVVATAPKSYAYATILAGMLPMGYTSDGTLDGNGEWTQGTCNQGTATCYVVAGVPPPGQNLNNATAVNYAGLYHSGACVPVPTCPASGGQSLKAEILAVPASVSGVNDAPSGAGCDPTNLSGCTITPYPLNSFTVRVMSPVTATLGGGPNSCTTGAPTPCYTQYDSSGNPVGQPINDGRQYWRVCLSVVTEKGTVQPNASNSVANQIAWGQLMGNIMAMTRCSISGEPSGAGFTVWQQ